MVAEAVKELPMKRIGVHVVRENVTNTRLPLFTDNGYQILVERVRKGKKYRAIISKNFEPFCDIRFSNPQELADGIARCDQGLAPYAKNLADTVFQYINSWSTLALRNDIRKIYSLVQQHTNQIMGFRIVNSYPFYVFLYGDTDTSRVSYSGETVIELIHSRLGETIKELKSISFFSHLKPFISIANKSGETDNVKKLNLVDYLWSCLNQTEPENLLTFNHLFDMYRALFGDGVGDLLELVVTAGISLRFVDREKGLTSNRPIWLLTVAPPSSLKSTTINMISKAEPYVYIGKDLTPASLLPADPQQEPVIVKMHNRVTLFSTLSQLAEKDEKAAREVMSKLESIYDGWYGRDTAKGSRESIVDTVIIGALTPDIYERTFLGPMISYGSRFLIYRYSIPDDVGLTISKMLTYPQMTRLLDLLRDLASALFIEAMGSVTSSILYNTVIPPSLERDIDVLSMLLAKLRVSFHQVRYQAEDESGRLKWVTEYEITQTDIPIRSRIQLTNLVKANAVIRCVPRFLGYPVVDEHAVRLAAKVAIGSSSKYMADILIYVAKEHNISNLNQSVAAKALKISKSTLNRYVNVLYQIGILIDTTPIMLDEEYREVLEKYLLNQGGSSADQQR